jgi:hypothetical protein
MIAENFYISAHSNCRNLKLISFKETLKNFKDGRKYKPLYSSLKLASGTVWFMLSHVLPFTIATGKQVIYVFGTPTISSLL